MKKPSEYDDPVEFGEQILGETYTDDVKEFMWSVVNYRATIARSANATGKSHALARIAIWFLLRYDDAQIFTAAAPPESNLRNILWGEIGLLLEKHKYLFGDFRINDLKITRRSNPKSFLAGVTIPTTGTPAKREAAFSGKHAPHLLFICDEADGIPAEVYRGIESCMSGGHSRLVVCFNPRHPSGRIYQMERNGEANVIELSAFRHPNVVKGEDVYPGAVDRETTLRRINEWSVPVQPGEKITDDCYVVPDFLVGTTTKSLGGEWYPELPAGHRRMVEPVFAYMVLGKYPSEGKGQLIRRTWIDAAFDRWRQWVGRNGTKPPEGVRPILGLDVAEFGEDRNSLCPRYDGFVPEIKTWGGVDVIETANRAADYYSQVGAKCAFVDGTGVGSGVAPKMEEYQGVEAYSVKVASSPNVIVEEGEFAQMRDQLWWMTREWLRRNPNAALPPDEELAGELMAPRYEKTGGGAGKIKISSKDDMREALGGRSPDKAESLILTFFNEGVESEDPEGALAHALFKHRGQ